MADGFKPQTAVEQHAKISIAERTAVVDLTMRTQCFWVATAFVGAVVLMMLFADKERSAEPIHLVSQLAFLLYGYAWGQSGKRAA